MASTIRTAVRMMGERISDEEIAGNRPRVGRLFYNSKHALSTNILLKQQLDDFKM
jgi:hypothetical protein